MGLKLDSGVENLLLFVAAGALSDDQPFPQRTVVLISPTGIVRHHATYDLKVPRAVDEVVRVLKFLKQQHEKDEQHMKIDETAQGCPDPTSNKQESEPSKLSNTTEASNEHAHRSEQPTKETEKPVSLYKTLYYLGYPF